MECTSKLFTLEGRAMYSVKPFKNMVLALPSDDHLCGRVVYLSLLEFWSEKCQDQSLTRSQ